ncbi:aminopeptidase [Gemmatimonadetes bacterium T265]|nr:aminopeptidase [Gemmatimonadetes bacterium T265]
MCLLCTLFPSSLVAQARPGAPATSRRTGEVGVYVPPTRWPQRARVFDLLHQRIAISFDLAQRSVTGEVATRLVITAAPTDTVRLDASNLTIDAALDALGRPLRYVSDTAGVTVRLPRRAARGDTVQFTLRYHGRPERGMYFVPRRPTVWTQGEAIETPSWVPTYNAPNDKTTWEILVTADTGMRVLSNGRLVSVTPTADRRQQVWHWSQEKPASTYLYSIVAAPFTVLHDSWRGIPVEYWVAPDTVNAAWRTFGETPAMIETYSRVLGVNFPWAKYDQAVIPDFTYGGMENVSATTQTDLALHDAASEPERSGRGLTAHELAHQWFGDLTTTAEWAHAWVNEGLTTYMESVQEEQSRGREAAQWNWIGQQREAMAADLNEERPLVFGARAGTDPIQIFFSGHVYPKGAQLAHQLRRLVGDSLFWAGMRRFLTDNAYRPVETADYAVAMERATGRDLDWFFDQWAYGIGYPKVRVARAWDPGTRTLRLTVDETQRIDATHPFFRFPATVRVVTRDAVVRREIDVTAAHQTFEIPLPGAPISFRFDEGGWLLGTVTTDQTPAELAALARHDLDFTARWWALGQLAASADTAARAARRLIALNDESSHLRAAAVRQLAGDPSPESEAVVRAALADPSSEVRAATIRALAVRDSAGVQAAAVALIQHDPSTAVQTAALSVYDPALAPEGTALLVDRVAHGGSLGMRGVAASRLVRRPDAAGLAALEAATSPDEPRELRVEALRLLAAWPDRTRAVAVATRSLADADPLFAVAAARQLGAIGGPGGRTTIAGALARESRVTVRAALSAALGAGR